MHRRILARLLSRSLCGLLLSLGSCGSVEDRPRVVVYVSADEYVARPILDRFEDETGIDVEVLYDTEATKTTGLVSRLIAERQRPRADLFWSSECFRMIELQEAGVLGRFPSEQVKRLNQGMPPAWCSTQDAWIALAPRARVIVYAPDRLEAGEVPDAWEQLVDPRWNGRLAMADPRFGTTGGHLGAMLAAWGSERYGRWLDGLVSNQVAVLTSGNAGVVEGVARGEFDLGMTDTDDVWAARERGLGVELVYPRHQSLTAPGGGTLLIPNTVGIIRGAANPDSAHALAEWLASAEVERLLEHSPSRNIPVRGDPGALEVPDPLQVELERAALQRVEALEAARRCGLLQAG
ncbi:MAG: extracellular solute-binding protein [Planctomycetota bacterium]|nr:extracellular solute-binding protein [Planctomycetota bacterium]